MKTIKFNIIWMSMQTTLDQAMELADFINKGLGKEHQIAVVEISNKWYMLVGDDTAKDWYTIIYTELKKEQQKSLI